MSLTDPIADLLARIRNAQMVNKPSITLPSSKLLQSVVKLLSDEGYVGGYSVEGDKKPSLTVELKYSEQGPAIKYMKKVSTPGRRTYSRAKDLPLAFNGLGVNVISTSKGVMTDANARKQSLGGEILCTIY